MSATIKYKGNTIASITTDSSKTLKTNGKYCEDDIVVENVQDGGITPSGNKAITATTSTQTGIDVTNYATVSVAPTPSETKSVTTNGDVTPSSGKLLSKVTVNVPTGTARDSSDLTVSGATVNVPAGLYSSTASKSVASGTAGTPTASKGAVSNNSVTVTPSVTNTEGYITGGTKTGTGVKVSASELVSGNKALTPSETAQSGIDVTNFKTASVGAISSTYVGSGVTRKAAATVAPSTSEQTVCASGVYTTGEQKVSEITPSIVGNLDASSFAASIVAAVEGKGVTVPSGTMLDGMASLIESIEAGGGGGFNFLNAAEVVSGTITPTSRILFADYEDISVTFSSKRPDKRVGCFLMYDIAPDDNPTYIESNTSLTTMSDGDLVAACCTWGRIDNKLRNSGVTFYKSGNIFASDNNFYAKQSSAQVISFYVSSSNSKTYLNSGRTYAWVAFVINATKY